MKIYLLVEGEETEMNLYPFWLTLLIPSLIQADSLSKIIANSFYAISGYGWPSMIDNNHLINSIQDVNANGTFDYLVVCIDADGKSIADKKNEIATYLSNANIQIIPSCELVIIVQNPCIETWLLGSRNNYPKTEQNKNFKQHQDHFDVYNNDPELMPEHPFFRLPISRYHFIHLVEMLKPRIRYSKSNWKGVKTEDYFQDMIDRITTDPTHLKSFAEFISFCDVVIAKMI